MGWDALGAGRQALLLQAGEVNAPGMLLGICFSRSSRFRHEESSSLPLPDQKGSLAAPADFALLCRAKDLRIQASEVFPFPILQKMLGDG
jgi:hypothetical protein